MDDRIDGFIREWHERRPDLDFSPLEIVARVIRASHFLQARLDRIAEAYGRANGRSRCSHRSRPGGSAPPANTLRAGRTPPPHHGRNNCPSQPFAKSRARRTAPQSQTAMVSWCVSPRSVKNWSKMPWPCSSTPRRPALEHSNPQSKRTGQPAPRPPHSSRQHPGISTRHRGANADRASQVGQEGPLWIVLQGVICWRKSKTRGVPIAFLSGEAFEHRSPDWLSDHKFTAFGFQQPIGRRDQLRRNLASVSLSGLVLQPVVCTREVGKEVEEPSTPVTYQPSPSTRASRARASRMSCMSSS